MKSSKPQFKKKVMVEEFKDLKNAFKVDVSRHYLESRAINSGEFYFVENFKEFINTLKLQEHLMTLNLVNRELSFLLLGMTN